MTGGPFTLAQNAYCSVNITNAGTAAGFYEVKAPTGVLFASADSAFQTVVNKTLSQSYNISAGATV